MPSEWLKYGADLPEKPEVALIAAATGLDRFSVCGRLMAVWTWFSRNSTNGLIAVGSCDAPVALEAQQMLRAPRDNSSRLRALLAHIDRIAQHEGFADEMLATGWLRATDDAIFVPNWDRHNSQTAKKRGLAANRMSRVRRSQPAPEAQNRDASVAPPLRTERNTSATRIEKKRGEKKSPPAPQSPHPQRADSAPADPEPGGGGESSSRSDGESGAGRWFLTAWGLWPNHRRVKQHECRAMWGPACEQVAVERGCPPDDAAQWLIGLIDRFRVSPKGQSEKCPTMHTWLEGARWHDDEATWTLDQKPKPAKQRFTEPPKIAEARARLREGDNALSPDPHADELTPLEVMLRICTPIFHDSAAVAEMRTAFELLGLHEDQREDALIELERRRTERKRQRKQEPAT